MIYFLNLYFLYTQYNFEQFLLNIYFFLFGYFFEYLKYVDLNLLFYFELKFEYQNCKFLKIFYMNLILIFFQNLILNYNL